MRVVLYITEKAKVASGGHKPTAITAAIIATFTQAETRAELFFLRFRRLRFCWFALMMVWKGSILSGSIANHAVFTFFFFGLCSSGLVSLPWVVSTSEDADIGYESRLKDVTWPSKKIWYSQQIRFGHQDLWWKCGLAPTKPPNNQKKKKKHPSIHFYDKSIISFFYNICYIICCSYITICSNVLGDPNMWIQLFVCNW